MTVNPVSFRFPFEISGKAAPEIEQAIRYHSQGLLDLNQAIASLKTQIDAKTTSTSSATTTEVVSGASSSTVIQSILAALGTVNDQTGTTAYSVGSSDNGILLILNDASPVAVSLNSIVVPPFACFIANFGTGLVSLTPTSGTINGGSSLSLFQNQTVWTVFDGTNWKTGAISTPPQNTPAIAHEFITAFNAATGVFTQAQPAFTDITGQITTSQLPASGLTVTITTAALTGLGTQGSMTFTGGILTAQTPAT